MKCKQKRLTVLVLVLSMTLSLLFSTWVLEKIETFAASGDGTYTWPVSIGIGTSSSGMYYSGGTYHGGVDFKASVGSEVYAIASGKVILATDRGCLGGHNGVAPTCSLGKNCNAYKYNNGTNGSYGNWIIIDHGNNVYSLYAHLSTGSFKVSVGDTVSQGQIIAYSGAAGNTYGAHLHLELRMGGNTYKTNNVYPLDYLTKINVSPSNDSSINNSSNYVDLGTNFYSNIVGNRTGLYFTNKDGNVSVQAKDWSSDQMWYFERQSDGSYKISSRKDNAVMEVYNFETSNGTNVTMNSDYNGNAAQRWYIYAGDGGYQLRAAFAPNGNTMDVDAATGNVQMYAQLNNENQKFSIGCLSAPNIGSPTIEVSNYGDDEGNNVKFTWNECSNSTGYDLRVYDAEGKNVLYTFWNVQGTSYITKLPSGIYQIAACALNSEYNLWTAGTFTKFVCAENLGTNFYSNIVGNRTGLYFTNKDGNVSVQKKDWSSDQMWYFERQSDGSYKISSRKDNAVMEVYNFETSNGTNVTMNSDYNGNAAQRWYIYAGDGGYQLRAAFAPNGNTMDVDAATGNVQMYAQLNNENQKFSIGYLAAPNIGSPTIEVSDYGDDEGNNVKFTWNECSNSTGYDLRVYDAEGKNVLYTFWNVQGTSYITKLPSGTYQIAACALNSEYNLWTGGEFTKFIVNENHIHSYTDQVIKVATCSESGAIEYTCSCGNSYTEAIPITEDHIWDSGSVTSEATLTTTGTITYTCTVCGETKTEIITKDSDIYISTAEIRNESVITGGENGYTGETETIENLTKTALEKATIILSKNSVVYTGKVQKPSVMVKVSGVTVPSSQYTVSYRNNKKVGTASVTIKANSEATYVSGSVTETFKITKAANPLTVDTTSKNLTVANCKKKAQTFTIKVSKAKGTVSYKAQNTKYVTVSKGKITVKKSTPKGTYTIKVTAKGNRNYNSGTKTVTITVK